MPKKSPQHKLSLQPEKLKECPHQCKTCIKCNLGMKCTYTCKDKCDCCTCCDYCKAVDLFKKNIGVPGGHGINLLKSPFKKYKRKVSKRKVSKRKVSKRKVSN